MKKLECIIVHGSMPSVSSSASLSLATWTICTILLMFVTARLFANEVDYYKLLNIVFFTFFDPDLEKEEDYKRSIFDISHL